MIREGRDEIRAPFDLAEKEEQEVWGLCARPGNIVNVTTMPVIQSKSVSVRYAALYVIGEGSKWQGKEIPGPSDTGWRRSTNGQTQNMKNVYALLKDLEEKASFTCNMFAFRTCLHVFISLLWPFYHFILLKYKIFVISIFLIKPASLPRNWTGIFQSIGSVKPWLASPVFTDWTESNG
jgi:hypothetical protein